MNPPPIIYRIKILLRIFLRKSHLAQQHISVCALTSTILCPVPPQIPIKPVPTDNNLLYERIYNPIRDLKHFIINIAQLTFQAIYQLPYSFVQVLNCLLLVFYFFHELLQSTIQLIYTVLILLFLLPKFLF